MQLRITDLLYCIKHILPVVFSCNSLNSRQTTVAVVRDKLLKHTPAQKVSLVVPAWHISTSPSDSDLPKLVDSRTVCLVQFAIVFERTYCIHVFANVAIAL